MPLPIFLFGAVALVSAVVGTKKAVEASENFDEATRVGNQAADKYKQKSEEVELSRKQVAAAMVGLSRLKIKVFEDQIKHLVDAIGKLKKASSRIDDFDEVIIYDDALQLSKAMGFDNKVTERLLSSAVTVAAITPLASVSGFIPLVGLGGIFLKNKSEQSLTDAYVYESAIENKIGELECEIVECQSLIMMAGERFNAINQMVAVYENCKSDDASDAAIRHKMIEVGKALKSMISLRTDDNETFEKIKIAYGGFLYVESSTIGA